MDTLRLGALQGNEALELTTAPRAKDLGTLCCSWPRAETGFFRVIAILSAIVFPSLSFFVSLCRCHRYLFAPNAILMRSFFRLRFGCRLPVLRVLVSLGILLPVKHAVLVRAR